jgi:hypothetical protein
MDAAHRPGGALIRDKDGTPFLLRAARTTALEQYALQGLRSAMRTVLVLQQSTAERDPLHYGDFSWLATLPEHDQHEFVVEYVRALEAVEATGTEPVEQLVYEWQQTARAWADEDLRGELTADLPEPLHDVSL